MLVSDRPFDVRRWLEARPRVEIALFVAILVFGLVARLGQLWYRPAFWGDEAALAMNIEPRGFLELGRPFVYRQVAPWGVLAGIKLTTVLFGASDLGFRMFPFAGSVVALLVVYPIARRFAGPVAALVAMFLMACSANLTYYAAELKPYAIDAAVAGILVWLTLRVLEARHDRVRWFVLIAFGAFAGCLSLPSLFVSGACGAALLHDAWTNGRDLRRIGVIAAVGVLWVGAFAVHYQAVIVQSSVATSKGASVYWDPGFAPFPPKDLSDLRWYVGRYLYTFQDPGGFAHKYLAGAIGFAGFVVAVARRRVQMLILLVGPALLCLLASMLHKYPALERLLMFGVPAMVVLMGVGLAAMIERRAWIGGVAALACLLTVSMPRLEESFDFIVYPISGVDFEDLAAELGAQREPGEPVFLAGSGLATIYDHYGPKYGLAKDYVGRYDPRRFDDEGRFIHLPKIAETLFGRPRVWFILSTYEGSKDPNKVGRTEEALSKFIPRYLERHGGREISRVEAYDMILVLYDLSGAVPPEGAEKYENGVRVAQSKVSSARKPL